MLALGRRYWRVMGMMMMMMILKWCSLFHGARAQVMLTVLVSQAVHHLVPIRTMSICPVVTLDAEGARHALLMARSTWLRSNRAVRSGSALRRRTLVGKRSSRT